MMDGRQIQAARALLGWSVDYLAHRADVHRTTLRRIERSMDGIRGQAGTVLRIEEILKDHGIECIHERDKIRLVISKLI